MQSEGRLTFPSSHVPLHLVEAVDIYSDEPISREFISPYLAGCYPASNSLSANSE